MSRTGHFQMSGVTVTAGTVPFRGFRTWYQVVGELPAPDGKLPLLVVNGGPGCPHDAALPEGLVPSSPCAADRWHRGQQRRSRPRGTHQQAHRGHAICSETKSATEPPSAHPPAEGPLVSSNKNKK